MRVAIVRTPSEIPFTAEDKRNIKAIGQIITGEMRIHKRWTSVCTSALENNPTCLFLFDRFNYSLKKAFGADCFIALNPCMLLCYHPACRGKNVPPRKLRNMFNLFEYLDHLENHTDAIGLAMQLRFKEVAKNPFATKEELDEIAPAPFILCGFDDIDNCNNVCHIEQYGIQRIMHQFSNSSSSEDENLVVPNNPNYICHWKDLLISSGIIKSSSLCFQEDDAFIHSVLRYPNPIPDWSTYGTLSLYALKIKSAVSDTALSLHRGVTLNRLNTKPESLPDVKEFARSINHPSTSITRTQQLLPALKYENKTFHGSELLFQITCLERFKESFRYDFGPYVTRFPVTAGIDEQENNQGTFVNKVGELCGLKNKMTADDIRRVGLDNLGTYIAEENPFVIAVRECRLTDFGGIYCSNALTTFETHALNANECSSELDEMVSFAISCKMCLKENLDCHYDKLNEPCQSCVESGAKCTSLVVFHVLWDMGSSHKKVGKTDMVSLLNSSSEESSMMSSKSYTIGFGGLHLGKAFVNSARNHVMQFNGEHFGINILISVRRISELLQLLKNAVFVGKDRQSDLLAYLTVCLIVQQALNLLKTYCVQRVPEKYLPYKSNASSQKKIVYAVDVCANSNGEVFVLDTGAACIHVVDRSTVASVFLLGKYNSPCTKRYAKSGSNAASNIKLSNSLKDISVDSFDNIYVTDSGRKEVLIVRNCTRAKKCVKTKFHVLKVKGIISSAISTQNDILYVLKNKKSGQVIQLMSFKLTKKPNDRTFIDYEVLLKMRPSSQINQLFAMPFDRCFGGVSTGRVLRYFTYSARSKGRITEFALEQESLCKPFVNVDGLMVTTTNSGVNVNKLNFDGKTVSERESSISYPEYSGTTTGLCLTGKVTSAVVVSDHNFSLLQLGPLDFAIRFASALTDLYDAIGYIPPRGDREERLQKRRITFQESIKKGKNSVQFFNSMQQEAELRNPGRSSFQGPDGMPFTDTIKSLESTVQSWEVIEKRCELIKEGSSSLIYPPAVTSEKNVEHGFGFIGKKGQGNNMTMEEYIIAKRRSTVDFQLRMSKMPFCQHIKDSVQDKGYQQIEGDRCKITVKDLQEIFDFSKKEGYREDVTEIAEEDNLLVKKAYLLSKGVPRQTNRAKWREKSGYQPNMLLEKVCPGMLLANDLVCCRSVTDTLMFLIVQEDVLLRDVDVKISVRFPGGSIGFHISSDKLVVANGQIMTLPSQVYDVVDGEVILSDAVAAQFQYLSDNQGTDLSEEEWAVLIDTTGLPDEETVNKGSGKRKSMVENGKKKKKRKT